jgi:hypothetical protein
MSRRAVDKLILASSSWPDFLAAVSAMANETDKGECFERLVQLYMQSAPHMVSRYQHVWLRAELPGDVKAALRLPDTDEASTSSPKRNTATSTPARRSSGRTRSKR